MKLDIPETEMNGLIETQVELNEDVRWASCNIFSTQDRAAAIAARHVAYLPLRANPRGVRPPHSRRDDDSSPSMILYHCGDATGHNKNREEPINVQIRAPCNPAHEYMKKTLLDQML